MSNNEEWQTVQQWLNQGNKITELPTCQYEEPPEKKIRRQTRVLLKEVLKHCTHVELAAFAKSSRSTIGKIAIRYHVGDETYRKVHLALGRIVSRNSFDKEALEFCKKYNCFIDSSKLKL